MTHPEPDTLPRPVAEPADDAVSIERSWREPDRFAEAARVLRPGGRLAISDIVSGHALKERTRRNIELWAACIAGAIPRDSYVQAIETQGLQVRALQRNDYRFVSERALDACSRYGVESVSLLAVKPH